MTTHTLYKVQLGLATYFSTSPAEITAFASIFGMIGHAEEHGTCLYQIPNVVAQHPPGTFKGKIKRQYLPHVINHLTKYY